MGTVLSWAENAAALDLEGTMEDKFSGAPWHDVELTQASPMSIREQ